MATQIFGQLFPKTLTSLTSFRSFSTRATILSLIKRLNRSPYSTLADVVGCEEEARMMVYSGRIDEHYYFFGTLLSEELHYKVEGLLGVSRVRRENIDEMTWSMPLDQPEKKFKKAIAKEEEFSRLLLTK